jgi:hypothetical protein
MLTIFIKVNRNNIMTSEKGTKLTPSQKQQLRQVRDHLRQAFETALTAMMMPGQTRDWAVRFLAEVLKVYTELRETRIDGAYLHRLLAPGGGRRERLSKLLKKTTNRDSKTRSRWAGVLAKADKANVDPSALAGWLKDGGGIAGRS